MAKSEKSLIIIWGGRGGGSVREKGSIFEAWKEGIVTFVEKERLECS